MNEKICKMNAISAGILRFNLERPRQDIGRQCPAAPPAMRNLYPGYFFDLLISTDVRNSQYTQRRG